MYKCGWNGCEKAYGTLNHLNAHVTMQSHGQKRIPEGMLPSVFLLTPVFTIMRSCGRSVMSTIKLLAPVPSGLIDGYH